MTFEGNIRNKYIIFRLKYSIKIFLIGTHFTKTPSYRDIENVHKYICG